eukprot:gnl/TRDRNA2_/TRDRNA2_185739_c0_seq1.p2 gnl/TRDRNA2_/TRDRNA2_185739_c0~~gnl/TRDRNA2_/TRDRNA2_185739_c0_seq1.p2  ORF type:complete len:234 (-),score=55.37 gnl/TRDRNA2_/TRDRNA2_185739_c0_seq1:122-721(-)
MGDPQSLSQILAILVLDSDGTRLASKYSSIARKELWQGQQSQLKFEKRVVNKLPKSVKTASSRTEADVAIIDDYTVLHQAVNDVIVCIVAAPSENELVVMQLLEGVFNAIQACAQGNFLSSGLTKQAVLDNLSDVLFILDEVVDDTVIMETEEDNIVARIKMMDETEANKNQEAEQMFQKATQGAKQKLLASLIGGSRG